MTAEEAEERLHLIGSEHFAGEKPSVSTLEGASMLGPTLSQSVCEFGEGGSVCAGVAGVMEERVQCASPARASSLGSCGRRTAA